MPTKPRKIKSPPEPYRTYNINEATYFIVKGFQHDTDGNLDRSTCFIFPTTPQLEKVRKEFWTKGAKVDLHVWLSVRQQVKDWLKGKMAIEANVPYWKLRRDATRGKKKEVTVDPNRPIATYTPSTGDAYWFVTNGTIGHALYGPNPIHRQRINDNNSFKTEEEAEISLARWKERNLMHPQTPV